jgi:arsenite oxidase small subunit
MARVHNQSAGHLRPKRVSRKGFVRLCAALGAGFAAPPLLAACGKSAEVEPGGGEPLNGGPELGGGETIAKISERDSRTAVPFTDADSGEQAVLLRLESGEFVAYSALCTHQGCVVASDAQEGMLECPCHSSVFDPAQSGEAVQGPAQQPLPDIPVEVQDGSVVRV